MNTTRRRFLTTAGACMAATSAQAQTGQGELTYAMIGAAAPRFSLPRLVGGRSALSDYRGRVLMLGFGGLWCAECVHDGRNISNLAAMAEADPDIAFLYMQCGPQLGLYGSNSRERDGRVRDARRAWERYFAERQYSYPIAFDLSRRLDLSRDYAIRWFPSNLIIDRDGVIRAWRTTIGRSGVETFFAQARALAQS